jgi:hypothetical protein
VVFGVEVVLEGGVEGRKRVGAGGDGLGEPVLAAGALGEFDGGAEAEVCRLGVVAHDLVHEQAAIQAGDGA